MRGGERTAKDTYEVAPCLAPVFDERVEGAAFYAVGEVDDGGAHDFVAAAYCEGLRLDQSLFHLTTSSNSSCSSSSK